MNADSDYDRPETTINVHVRVPSAREDEVLAKIDELLSSMNSDLVIEWEYT